ncbi:MAG: S8 family serine peptidase [Synergistaceae bacterium]|nr:S8 family serine peptidase [Synergistaceae bacterium]
MKHLPVEIVSLTGGNRIRSTAASRQDVLDSFRQIPGVRTAEYDVMRKSQGFVSPQSPRISAPGGVRGDMTAEQWYLDLTGAKEAWSTMGRKGDPSFVVAVIDTGVNFTHPDLAGAVWTNPDEIPDDGIDNDGNGYIDDWRGWNFAAGNNNAEDDQMHGSHVSGIIAATDDGKGITGVAAGVKILPLKVLDSEGWGKASDLILALDMVYDYKSERGVNIRAVNLSLGGDPYCEAELLSIERLASVDIPVFAAAGNDSMDNDFYDFFPANYPLPNIVSVGSLDRENKLSYFTNRGRNRVGVYSYGSEIYSTVLGTGYMYGSGTSMATPMACGVFLLGWSQYPEHTLSQALSRFYSGLVPMTDVGGGRTNAAAIMGVPEDPVVLSKTRDVYAFRGSDFTVFGSQLGDTTFTLGGAALDIISAGYNEATLRMNWGQWARGDLWRRIETPGYASARSPFVMPLDVQAGTVLPVSCLPSNRHLYKDGCFLQLGTALYMIVADDTLSARYLAVFNAEKDTYDEFLLPAPLGPDRDDRGKSLDDNNVSLFEHKGYIYIPGLAPFSGTEMHRFRLSGRTFDRVSYGGSTEFLKGAQYASSDDGMELYYTGVAGPENRLFRFNPETGERTALADIPYDMWNMAVAWHKGKIYIVGGERISEWELLVATDVSLVYDTKTGASAVGSLPFPAQGGQLLFSDNKLLYVMNRVTGDGFWRRILTAMTDLTESGWISGWEILPSISSAIAGRDFDTKGFFFKYPGERSLRVLSKKSTDLWNCRTFAHPAGTIRPDPVPPTPPASGGGGCTAGAVSPLLLLLAAPLLFMVFSRRVE